MEVVRILLEKGIDVNIHDGWYGNTPYAASIDGYMEVVGMLLEKGVDVNA